MKRKVSDIGLFPKQRQYPKGKDTFSVSEAVGLSRLVTKIVCRSDLLEKLMKAPPVKRWFRTIKPIPRGWNRFGPITPSERNFILGINPKDHFMQLMVYRDARKEIRVSEGWPSVGLKDSSWYYQSSPLGWITLR